MNRLDKPVTLTLTLQQVSRLSVLLKFQLQDLHGQYEIIPEDKPLIDADIAIAQATLDKLKEALKQ